jgi:hypothetical protein
VSHITIELDTYSESIHPEKSCGDVLRRTRSLNVSYKFRINFFQKEEIEGDNTMTNLMLKFEGRYRNIRLKSTDRLEEAIQILNWTEFLPEEKKGLIITGNGKSTSYKKVRNKKLDQIIDTFGRKITCSYQLPGRMITDKWWISDQKAQVVTRLTEEMQELFYHQVTYELENLEVQ